MVGCLCLFFSIPTLQYLICKNNTPSYLLHTYPSSLICLFFSFYFRCIKHTCYSQRKNIISTLFTPHVFKFVIPMHGMYVSVANKMWLNVARFLSTFTCNAAPFDNQKYFVLFSLYCFVLRNHIDSFSSFFWEVRGIRFDGLTSNLCRSVSFLLIYCFVGVHSVGSSSFNIQWMTLSSYFIQYHQKWASSH